MRAARQWLRRPKGQAADSRCHPTARSGIESAQPVPCPPQQAGRTKLAESYSCDRASGYGIGERWLRRLVAAGFAAGLTARMAEAMAADGVPTAARGKHYDRQTEDA